jgi:aryl-alcohol dehydrogenase-like predicted oxidoreductase
LGTAGIGGAWGKVDAAESIDTILYALNWGVGRIDTAPAYNMAEIYLGRALRKWHGVRPFISTKVGKDFARHAEVNSNNYNIRSMTDSLRRSAERLGGRPDLVFLHEPERVQDHPTTGDRGTLEVITWLSNLTGGKLASTVGLGGVTTPAYHSAIRAGVFSTIMSFNNLDAVCLDGLASDLPLYRRAGVTTYQGSALHMGLLGNRLERYLVEPPDWMNPRALAAARGAAEIARSAGIQLAELAHRYLISMHEVDYLVLGARNLAQLQSSLGQVAKGPLPKDIFNLVTQNTNHHAG